MNGIVGRRSDLLREVEQLCYQVAHYLLGNETDAAAAGEEALIELFRMPAFDHGSKEERCRLATRAAIRSALARAAKNFPENEKEPYLRRV